MGIYYNPPQPQVGIRTIVQPGPVITADNPPFGLKTWLWPVLTLWDLSVWEMEPLRGQMRKRRDEISAVVMRFVSWITTEDS